MKTCLKYSPQNVLWLCKLWAILFAIIYINFQQNEVNFYERVIKLCMRGVSHPFPTLRAVYCTCAWGVNLTRRLLQTGRSYNKLLAVIRSATLFSHTPTARKTLQNNVSVMSCIWPVLHPSCPACILHCICPVLHLKCPACVLSNIRHALRPSCKESDQQSIACVLSFNSHILLQNWIWPVLSQYCQGFQQIFT